MWWFCGPLKAASVNAIKSLPSLSQVSPKSHPSLFQISQQFYDAAEQQQQQQQRQLQIRYEFDYLSQSPIAYRIDLRLLWLLWSRAERGQLSLELHSAPPAASREAPLGRLQFVSICCSSIQFKFDAFQVDNETKYQVRIALSRPSPLLRCGNKCGTSKTWCVAGSVWQSGSRSPLEWQPKFQFARNMMRRMCWKIKRPQEKQTHAFN